MNIERQYDTPFKTVVCFQYKYDDVGLRLEFPRSPALHAAFKNNSSTHPIPSQQNGHGMRRVPPGLIASPYGDITKPLDTVTIVIYVTSLVELVNRAVELGFTPLVKPVQTNQMVKSATFIDPNGIRVQVVQVLGQPLYTPLNPTKKKKTLPTSSSQSDSTEIDELDVKVTGAELGDLDTDDTSLFDNEKRDAVARLGYLQIPLSSQDDLLQNTRFYSETCKVEPRQAVTWADHAATLEQRQDILDTAKHNEHISMKMSDRRNEWQENKQTKGLLTVAGEGSNSSRDMHSMKATFDIVDEELYLDSLLKQVWFGNNQRPQGVTVCFSHCARQEPQALFSPFIDQYQRSAPQSELARLLRIPQPIVSPDEFGLDGDGGNQTRQTLIPMQGHVLFLGLAFAVYSLRQTIRHMNSIDAGVGDRLEVMTLHSLPRHIIIEDEAGVPLELSDGITQSTIVESLRTAELARAIAGDIDLAQIM